jgi:2-amino-4-hydroxy-6-hydroxymethyldihydropteridine diphosphokinase
MNTAIVMLGSNIHVKKNIELTLTKLAGHFKITNKSPQVNTEPVGTHISTHFNNVALKLVSEVTLEETIAIFKQIEQEMGRNSDSKLTGIIPIDIDLIFWNEKLVHEDFNRFEYVKDCVNEIKMM